MTQIRNFSIIAHIDHGKSTLADRLIQRAGLVEDRLFRDQILDSMDLERERGITIKSHTITLPYVSKSRETFALNLIDTPGHVDFSYEVSRALASCDGVLLLVDASQGVQAQTLSNLYKAMEHDLTIVPVINKIDLPSADVTRVKEQIDQELGLDPDRAILCSAKDGIGIDEILEAVVEQIPGPQGRTENPLAALIFDARYDSFRGSIVSCRIFEGTVRPGDVIRFMHNQSSYKVEEVGIFRLTREPRDQLSAGEVGYIISGVKTVSDTRIGDTITLHSNPAPAARDSHAEASTTTQPMRSSSSGTAGAESPSSATEGRAKARTNDAPPTMRAMDSTGSPTTSSTRMPPMPTSSGAKSVRMIGTTRSSTGVSLRLAHCSATRRSTPRPNR